MTYLLLLAGGIGSRVNSGIAKQHIIIEDHQIIEYTLEAFSSCDLIDGIIIVSNLQYINLVNSLKKQFSKITDVIPGGETRIKSVLNGIKYLNERLLDDDKVIISDAARPCITKRETIEIVKALDDYIAVTTGITSNETILRTENNEISYIIQRDGIIRQTSPEGYRFSALKWLYLNNTDQIVSSYRNIGIDQLSACGVKIGIVKSNPLNFKITTREDLLLFESVLKQGFQNIINS